MTKLPRKVLCLDWDARNLRLVVARPGRGQMLLEDAHAHRIPADVNPESPPALGEFIAQALRRHRWRHTRALLNVPREKAVINRLTLPPTPPDEVAAAVRFQAMKELPFPLDSAVVDFTVLRRDEGGRVTEVLLAAVPLEALEGLRATCRAAGLEPARTGLRPHANLVSVRHLPELAEKRVLFVDVGPTMAEIDIMAGGQLAFARSANVNVPLSGAADDPDAGEPAAPPAAPEETDAAVRELLVEITRTLQAYRATEPDAGLDQVVIAGGTGVEPQLRSAVGQRFELPATLFDPTAALAVDGGQAEKLRSFSAALGLGWGLGRDGTLAIDFENPKKPIPPRARLKRRLRTAGLVAGAVVAAALALDLTLYLRESGKLRTERSRASELRRQLKVYTELENKVAEVHDWQFAPIWPEHLRRITEQAVEPGKSMLVQQISLDATTASMNLKKILATDMRVPQAFVAKLNEIRENGTLLYRAAEGSWRSLVTRSGTGNFTGTMDVQVELRDLKTHLEQRERRERERLTRTRKL